MLCPKCSNEVSHGVKFCSECGYAFTEDKVTPSEPEISKLIGQRALRVLGWVLVPYIMIFLSWKGLRGAGKTFGMIWAIFAFISTFNALNRDHDDTKPLSTAPVTAIATPEVKAEAKAKQDEEAKLKAEADAKAKADAIEKAPHMNELTEVGKFSVVVADKIDTIKIIGNHFLNKTALGIYWAIGVGIKNNDKKARMVDTTMFKLISSDGSEYEPDLTASMYGNVEDKFFLQNINPNIGVVGFVVFDMPADKKTSDFVLRVDSGMGFKAGSHVDFVLKKR
jgi:hypothetical protein